MHLKPYQEDATRFMLTHERGQMSIDMGLGKTIIALNYIDAKIRLGDPAPTLIIAPLRVARNTWVNEVAKWDHLKHLTISVVVGTPAQRNEALRRKADIYTINYENLQWLASQNYWPFKTVIADESTKLKSHRSHFRKKKDGTATLVCTGGARTASIASLAFRKTKNWFNLTGTPSLGGLTDLWGQYWFLDKGARLGQSYTAFTDRWYKLGFNGYTLEMLPHTEKEIREAIADVTYTLRADDYLGLGEEIVNTILVELPPKALALYKDMETDLFIKIKAGDVEAFTAAAKSQKCHQLANGAVYHDDKGSWEQVHDVKIEALESVVEEASGVPVLVAYQFKSDLVRLKEAFPKGKMFDEGVAPVMFIHPDSAGHGIDGLQNITNIICLFSLSWNAETRAQVIARIGRVRQYQSGFDRPVYIHQIAAKNTVDEDILARVEQKISVEEALKLGLARRNIC